MWNNQAGVLEMILEFFRVHFPEAQVGTEQFKSCLLEVLALYESSKQKEKGKEEESPKDIPEDLTLKEYDCNDLNPLLSENAPAEIMDSTSANEIVQLTVTQSEPSAEEDIADGQDENELPPVSPPAAGPSEEAATDYFPCAFCGEIFPTHAAYEGHANSHHIGETRSRTHHECDVCGRCFDSYLSFKRHRINHSLVKPFTCDLCTRAFTRNHDLQRHKANVHRIRSYLVSDAVRILNRHVLPSCQRCKRSFSSRALLEEHLQSRKCVPKEAVSVSSSSGGLDGGAGGGVIGGSGPFLCERCGMTFEQSGRLAEHRASACRGGPPMPPPNVTFPSESIGPLSFASDCLFKFGRPDTEAAVDLNERWKMEVVEEGGHEDEPDLACDHCSAKFRLETDLVEHRILEHTPLPGSKRQHSSDGSPEASMDGNEESLSKQLITSYPLSRGEADDVLEGEEEEDDEDEDEDDDDEDDDDDDDEDDDYEEATDLSMKPKDPSASSATGATARPDDDKLTADMDNGTAGESGGSDVWVCVYCSHSFCNKATLDRHMRTHTGEKPFQCPVCVKRFTRKHDLERHRSNIHEGVRPFTCPYCPKNFPLKKNLSKHLVMTHRISEALSGSPLGPLDVSM